MQGGKLPRYWQHNFSQSKRTEEDRNIQECKNELIEIQMGAKNALRLLNEA